MWHYISPSPRALKYQFIAESNALQNSSKWLWCSYLFLKSGIMIWLKYVDKVNIKIITHIHYILCGGFSLSHIYIMCVYKYIVCVCVYIYTCVCMVFVCVLHTHTHWTHTYKHRAHTKIYVPENILSDNLNYKYKTASTLFCCNLWQLCYIHWY